jgi:DNA polymerase (family X)
MTDVPPRSATLERALAAALELEGAEQPDAASDGAASPAPVERRLVLPLGDVERQVAELLAYLRAGPQVERAEVAGEVRRRCDVVSEIDLLAASAHPEAVRRHFASWPRAQGVTIVDPSRARLLLPCGARAELRIVPRRCFGATLQHLTGSPAHAAALRQFGLEHGIRLSDYGVFRLDQHKAGARRIGGHCEEDVFAALGMQWIPPELREGCGELEAALAHALPALISQSELHGDLHVSWDGAGGEISAAALVHACVERGYDYCAISLREPDKPRDESAVRDAMEQLDAAAALHPGIRVLKALHVDIDADGGLPLDPGSYDIDLIIASARRRAPGVALTELLLSALEQQPIALLAQLDASGAGAGVAVDEVLVQAAACGVAIGVSGRPGSPNPSAATIRRANALGTRIAINSGGRSADELDWIRFAVDRARRGWTAVESVVNACTAPQVRFRQPSPGEGAGKTPGVPERGGMQRAASPMLAEAAPLAALADE